MLSTTVDADSTSWGPTIYEWISWGVNVALLMTWSHLL